MGNYRFKFSDMIPNAWFYKLRDMSKGRKQTATAHSRKKKQCSTLPASASSSSTTTKTEQSSSKPKQPHQCIPRKSYYFTRELNTSERIHNTSPEKNHNFISDTNFHPQQPRKSSSKQKPKRRTPRTTKTSSSSSLSPKLVTAICSCHNNNNNNNNNNNKNTTFESMSTKSTSQPEYSSSSPLDSSAESEFPEPEFRTDRVLTTDSFANNSINTCCGCRVHSNTNDIIIDVDNNSIARKGNNNSNKHQNGYDNDESSFSDLVLPPIVTKPAKFNDLLSDAKRKESKPRNRTMASNEEFNIKGSLKVKIVKEEDTAASVKEQRNITNRRYSVTSAGVRLRINSPRIGSRKVPAAHGGRRSVSSVSRRSLSDSFAVVKSSLNPQRDFRESMVEMIVQNNIRTSKDLEDLLACYLSLNSDEYHELIINVFKQIWLDLTDITCRKNNLS